MTIHIPTSDYVPFCLKLGESHQKKKHIFQIEKWWLEHQEVSEIDKDIWTHPTTTLNVAGNLCIKLRG